MVLYVFFFYVPTHFNGLRYDHMVMITGDPSGGCDTMVTVASASDAILEKYNVFLALQKAKCTVVYSAARLLND